MSDILFGTLVTYGVIYRLPSSRVGYDAIKKDDSPSRFRVGILKSDDDVKVETSR